MMRVSGEALRLNPGATISNVRTMDALIEPEVPVIVTKYFPGVAELPAVKVMVLVVVVELGVGAVTPLGRPDGGAKLTLPLKPLKPDTTILDVPESLWATVSELGERPSTKLCWGLTVRATVMVALSEPEVPVTVR